ncbi:MAG TPA: hypothetical protein VG496_13470 [Myxococcales bacterium]|nr:hypothetical protein [Myxococcales bacterium]
MSRSSRPGALAGLLALLVAQACLVPQSVDPIATRPHTIPRIDLTSCSATTNPATCLPDYLLAPSIPLDPQELADANATPPCQCRLDIKPLTVIADDPTVDVDVRVFVDYDLNVPRSQSPVLTIHLAGSFETTDTTRPLGDLLLDQATLGGLGTHVVELVLGETAGFAPDTVSPPHRAMLQDFESSTFKFVVEVLTPPVGTRQSCSDSPPPPSPAQVKTCP